MLQQFLLWVSFWAQFSSLPISFDESWATGGFDVAELTLGSGAEVVDGDIVTVDIVAATPDGREIGNSEKRGLPLRFMLGEDNTPSYLDFSVRGMALGGRRKLILPPALGFGAKGEPPIVPPNTTLILRIRVLRIEKPPEAMPFWPNCK